MDTKSAIGIIQKIWKHSGIDGFTWMPSITDIGVKNRERFHEGKSIAPRNIDKSLTLTESADWYFTPAVSSRDSRRAKSYPSQRVLWVDCDDGYDATILEKLRPSIMWETSPGHMQAVWLMSERIKATEYSRDGLMGLLVQALGADKSGVDIGQLLRVPGSVHHKGAPFTGKVLRNTSAAYSRGQILSSVAKSLGFPAGVASELGADDPWGDRSKILWKLAKSSSELGLPESLAYKMLRATKWSKWGDQPELLRADIARAYASPTRAKDKVTAAKDTSEDNKPSVTKPWTLSTVADFGPVLRKPISWVLPQIIPEGGCGLLVAAPKVGKTRIAIEIALGVATAHKPLGIHVPHKQPVAFLSLEDGKYLFSMRLNGSLNSDHGRYRYHWDGHIKMGYMWSPPAHMPLYSMFDQIDLSKPEDQQQLEHVIKELGLRLIIIDTLSMAIGRANVNDSTDMYSILGVMKKIAQDNKCAIMFIHHTRKRIFEKGESIQEKVLGSTALHAWSDFIMSLASPEEDNDFLRLGIQTKMGSASHYISSSLKIIKNTLEQGVAEEP